MAITVKHSKVSTIPDGTDTSVVRPSDWNDDHVLTGTIPVANGGTGASTLTGYVKGNGTSAMTASATVPSTDITGLGTMSTQNSNNISVTGGSMSGVTISDYVATATKGVANGVASLDGSGTVPVSQLPAAVLGALSYQGTWNASTNTPTLTSSVGTKGYYYVVSVAGSTNLNGITDWVVGDWAVYNGTVWQKVDNTDAVTSVNGYTGTVVLTNTDISGFGTMSTQNANAVAITGGAIDGTTIGATTTSTGKFTTLNASTSLTTPIVQASNSGGLSLKNSAGTTQISVGAGGGDNASINVSTNINGANAQIDISPTGTGHVHMKPTGTGSIEIAPTNVGTMDNMTIGATTARAITGTTITATTFSGSGASLTSIPNSALVNSAITINGTSTSLGGSISVGTVTSVAATVPSFLSVTGSPITTNGTLAIGYSGTALPLANGGTSSTSAPQAMANLMGFTSTATAAGTTTLTNTSSYYQLFTGSTTQTIVLPVTSTLQTGWTFHICNNSTGTLTVNSSGGNLLISVIAGVTVMCTCIGTTLTTAADWEAGFTDFSTLTGFGNVVLSSSPSLSAPTLVNSTLTGNISATGSGSATILLGTAVTTGTVDIGSTLQTGAISIGRSSSSQTVNIANGVISTGNTSTINIGTQGSTGSTTAITVGGAFGTSTTTVNGTLSAIGAFSSASVNSTGAITSGGLLTASAGLAVTGATTANNLTTQDGASGFTIKNATDATKIAQFDLSGLTTGTTYSYQVPAVSGSALATLGNISQTFTGATTFFPSTASSQLIFGSPTGTGSIVLGRSSATQIVNIATGVNTAAVKTINIGTGGTGGTTAITIGSAGGSTSTTTVNGTLIAGSGVTGGIAGGTF